MTSVLWYSNETPDVAGQGGQRRQYFQIRRLVEAGHDVTVVSLAGVQDDTSIAAVTDVRRLPEPHSRARLSNLRRDPASAIFDALPAERLVVAHIESWMHLRRRRVALRGPRLLDMHNVMSRRYAAEGRSRSRARWRRLEAAAVREFDAVSVCSARERLAFEQSTGRGAMVAAHGVEPTEWETEPRPRPQPVMKLFGNWDWDPNRRGLSWFLDEVLPLTRTISGLSVEVAGNGTAHLPAREGVTFVGRVADVSTFLADAWVVALPVMGGIGAPVKFAEALVTGVPLVLTEQASDGTAAPGVLVSDDPAAWARWVAQVVRDPNRYREASRGTRALALVERSWAQTTEPLQRWVEHG